MAAVFEVVTSGIENLQKAVKVIEGTTLAQERLQHEANELTRALRTLVTSGFSRLEKAQQANIQHSKATTAANQAQITSIQQLSKAWLVQGTAITDVNAQLVKQLSQSKITSSAIRELTLSTNANVAATREMFLAAQAETAMINKQAAGYAKIAGLMAERASLESGVSQALTVRAAREQALLAVEQQLSAVSGITLRNIQTRIVAESALTNAQKMRALAEMGLIDIQAGSVRATNAQVAANTRLTESQMQLHSAMRGVGAATGNLMLTYGSMLPMITAFAATMMVLKSIKYGTEFDYITKYSSAISDHTVTLEKLQSTLLNMKGLGKGPIEVADGYRELIKAGYSAEESLAQISYATKFAVVSEMELGQATQDLVGLTRAFAKDGITMADTADIIGKAALASSTDVSEMASAMSHLTELSTVADISLAEAATAMALLANAGIRGSKGATAIRTSILKILEPTESLKQAMNAAGVSLDAISSDGKIKGMKELFMSVQKILNVIPKQEQVAFLADMFDIRSLKGAANLLESIRTGSWDQMEQSLLNVKGVIGDLHNELGGTTKFWLDELSASFQRALIASNDSVEVTARVKELNSAISDPAFSAGVHLLETAALAAAGGIAGMFNETLGRATSFVEAIKTISAEIQALFNIKLPDWLDTGSELFQAATSLNPADKIAYVSKVTGAGAAYDKTWSTISEKTGLPLRDRSITGNPEAMTSSRGWQSQPLQSSRNFKSSPESPAVPKYALTTMNQEVHKQWAKREKEHADALENVAKLAPGTELKHAIETAEKDYQAEVREIEKNEIYKLLAPSIKKQQLDQAKETADLKKKYATEQYGKKSERAGAKAGREGLQTETAAHGLKQLADISYQVMPPGRAKDMTTLTKTYQDNSDKIRLVAGAHKELAGEAKKAQDIQDKAFESGKKNIDVKYITEYADKIDDLKNGLASISAKDKTLSVISQENAKIDVSFNKWRNTATAAAAAIEDDVTPAGLAYKKVITDMIAESKKLQPAMKEAFKSETVKKFADELKEINEQLRPMDEHTARIKYLSKAYDDQIKKAREYYSVAGDINVLTQEGTDEVARLNAEKAKTIALDTQAAITGHNLWNGFKAGVIEAKNELKTLGTLGNEIFKDLQGGIKGAFSGLLKGDTSAVGKSFEDAFKNMGDHAVDYMADRLTGMTTDFLFGQGSMLGDLMGGMFGGKPTGAAGSPLHVVVDGGLGGLGGGMLGPGYAGWTNPDGPSGMAMLGGGLAMAGGAYGMYAGAKNIKKGNVGTGAAQMALGGASAYQGAVTLNIINPGTATALVKGIGAKIGFSAATSAGTSAASAGGASASLAAAEAAYLGGQGAAGAAAASHSLAAAEAAYLGGQTATTGAAAGSSAAAGGGTASVAAVAPYAVAAAAALLVGYKYLTQWDAPSASAEIDTAGITPTHLGPFTDQVNAINDSILATVPTLQKYNAALYDSENQVLTLSNGTKQLQLQYDATAQAGHQWSREISWGNGVLTDAAVGIVQSFSAVPVTLEQVYAATGLASEAFGQFSAEGAISGQTIGELETYLQGLGVSAGDAAAAAGGLVEYVGNASGSINTLSSSVDQFGNNSDGTASQLEGLRAAIASAGNTASSTDNQIDSLSNSIDNFGNNSDGSANAVSQLTGSVSDLGSVAAGAAGAIAGSAGDIQKAFRSLESLSSENINTNDFSSMMVLPKGSSKDLAYHAAKGGPVGHAGGGMLQGGSGRVDDLYVGTINGRPQLATGGEYIINPKASKKHERTLDRINADTYADGGQLDSLMRGVDDTVAQASMIAYQFSLRKLNQEYDDLLKNLEEQGASAEQLTKAQQALGIETDVLTKEFSKGIKDLVLSMQDTIVGMRDNSVPSQLRQIEQQYVERLEKLTEVGAGPHLRALAEQEYSAKKAQAYGGGSDTAKDLLKEAQDVIRKAAMRPADYEKYGVDTQWQDKLKSLAESGGTPAQRGALIQAYRASLKELVDAPLKEAVTSLDSFKKGLAGTSDELQSSQQAQQKLYDVLAKAKNGDFSGLSKVSDFLGDISIKKADYATAADYARDYWRVMGATSQLSGLTRERAGMPAFAGGGYHAGGYRLVGEDGPEIEYTGPARVANRDQLIDISALLEELRALRQTVNSGNFAVARNTQKTAESLKRMEYNGIALDAEAL